AAGLPFPSFPVFSYSLRRGPAASKLPGAVPSATVKARSEELCALSRAKRLKFCHRYLGQTVSVLFETRHRSGLFTGLTDNYIRVGGLTDEDLRDEIRLVGMAGVTDGLGVGAVTF